MPKDNTDVPWNNANTRFSKNLLILSNFSPSLSTVSVLIFNTNKSLSTISFNFIGSVKTEGIVGSTLLIKNALFVFPFSKNLKILYFLTIISLTLITNIFSYYYFWFRN